MELNDALLEQLERYLTQQMSAEDAVLFEQQIESNPDLQEFLSVYESVDVFEEEEEWPTLDINNDEIKKIAQKFREPDTVAFAEKVHQFHQNRTGKPSRLRRNLVVFTSVAAACLLFLLQLWPSDITLNSVYNDYSSWDNLPSFSEKSAVNNDPRLLLEKAFNTQQYEDVISLSDSILSNTQTLEPNVLLYQGIAQLELDRFEDAIQTFPNLSKSNALDAHKGYWYIALVYAKQGDQQAFVAALKKVESDPSNFNYPQAVQLLKEFE